MDALMLIPRDQFEAKVGASPTLPDMFWHERPKDAPRAAHRVFLVTVRPDGALWLVQHCGVNTWAVDLTPSLELFEVTAGVPRARLEATLRAPRMLSLHDAMLFLFIANESSHKRSTVTVRLPKWLLADAAKANENANDEATRAGARAGAAARSRGAARDTPGGSPAPAHPKRKRTALPTALLDGALAQIDAAVDDLRGRPARWLAAPRPGKRGRFTDDVQSIFAGVLTVAQARRALAAFATARELAAARTDDAIDALAIRALDELCRGLVAAALGRARDVPRRVKAVVAALPDDVAYVRALLT